LFNLKFCWFWSVMWGERGTNRWIGGYW